MQTKYSNVAQTVLTKAESIAFETNSSNVNELHLLLGVIYQSDFITSDYFESNNISFFKLCSLIGNENKNIKNDNSLFLEYSSNLVKILEKSSSLSKELNEDKISLNVISFCLFDSKSKSLESFCKDNKIDLFTLKNIIIRTLSRKSDLDNIIDLTDLSKVKHDPLIGREKELNMLIRTIKRRNKPNAILIGEPGIGKTSIVEELAQLLQSNKIPGLENYRLYELDLPSVVGGTKYRGEFEEKIKKILKKIKDDTKAIIFIDEIHNVIKAGGAEGAIDASNILKPYLSRNEICIIGATTINEYYQSIDKDKALARRFNVIKLEPSSKEETLLILNRIKSLYEKFYSIKIDVSILEYIVECSDKYFNHKYFPDKAIDLLDNSCVISQSVLDKNDVKKALLEVYNVDIEDSFEDEMTISFNIKNNNRNIGMFLQNIKKDHINTLLIYGSKGVGKTKTAKEIGEYINPNSCIKINMILYKDLNSFTTLFSDISSYEFGYNIPSLIRLNPNTSIIFDNIDCVNDDVFNMISNIIEDEYIIIKNSKINCSNLTLIFVATEKIKTTNTKSLTNTFYTKDDHNEVLENTINKRLLNFIDSKICIERLNMEEALNYLNNNLDNQSMILENNIDEKQLSEDGYWYLKKILNNINTNERFKIKN